MKAVPVYRHFLVLPIMRFFELLIYFGGEHMNYLYPLTPFPCQRYKVIASNKTSIGNTVNK